MLFMNLTTGSGSTEVRIDADAGKNGWYTNGWSPQIF
jgi:hypothetical protein